ncbi:MAG: protein disulfide-isomerase precursor [Claussenomyces sp. TS43310]|nr:MAG: protein disulfide-isomerase precursor [Claussenomyces sp. TS43310]
MKSFQNIALGLIGAAAVASAADGSSDVFQLKTDTFPEFIKENPLVLAEFFAPWCGHCKALGPEYEEAATTLKEKDIKLAKVDCTEEAELCRSYGVEGYPTLKVFRGPENVSPYQGQRKAGAITSYMVKQSLPAVSILSKDTIEEFKTADKIVLVGYFDPDDKTWNETYTTVAESLRDSFLFGATGDATLAKAEGAAIPSIVLYKSFDEGKSVFDGKCDVASIETFAKTASMPLVGEIGPETYSGYMSAGLPLAYIFAETPEERTKLSDLLKSVAEKHRGAISFATIDAKSFGAHAGNLNLATDKFPAFAIQDTVKNQKFPYGQHLEITAETIGSFVQDFVDGKIEPSIKSESVPESQDGPVHVVVAHNYKDIVLDDAKDVLIEFYAPWCGHCKALAPKYEELAALYFNDPELSKKVTIAKVDATANDVPDEIQGFPTIKLYPAGAKDSPVDYSGSRTVEDLIKFIAENGKHKAEVAEPEQVDAEMTDADDMAKQAAAATKSAASAAEKVTDAVKSKISEGAEAVETAVADNDDGKSDHDEL